MSDKSSKGIRVFVYGTLKQDHPNHGFLDNCLFLGRCTISGHRMVDLGAFPGIISVEEDDPFSKVSGEVYVVNIDTLHALDRLEGHPTFYERIKVTTPWKKSWVYVLPKEYGEHRVIPTGVWRPSVEELTYLSKVRQGEAQ